MDINAGNVDIDGDDEEDDAAAKIGNGLTPPTPLPQRAPRFPAPREPEVTAAKAAAAIAFEGDSNSMTRISKPG